MKVKLISHAQLFMTPWTVAYQAPQSMGFSRQEYWSGLPFPSPQTSCNISLSQGPVFNNGLQTSQVEQWLKTKKKKNPPANEGDGRNIGSIPWSGRSPRVGNGNSVHCSCLKNSMNREAWWTTVHGATKSWT